MLRFIMQFLGLRRSGWRAPAARGRMGMLPVGGLLPLAWLAWTNRDHIRSAIERVRQGGPKALLQRGEHTATPQPLPQTMPATFR